MSLPAARRRPIGDTGAEPVAEMTGVTVIRAGRLLLADVHWTVRPGQRWVVFGANGAGKTTLLRVLAGTIRPTGGYVHLLGQLLARADLDELLPRIGWCAPVLAERLPPDRTAVDTVLAAAYAAVARGGEWYGPEDETRARQLLAELGCRDLVQRRYGTLSDGERKRVQVARALMPDPELLLLDEPAAGLDVGGREALLRRLGRLAADPAAPAMVLVAHQVEDVPPGFTHAIGLRHGRVVAAGPLLQVLTGPVLSACFGLPLRVAGTAGRFTARADLSLA